MVSPGSQVQTVLSDLEIYIRVCCLLQETHASVTKAKRKGWAIEFSCGFSTLCQRNMEHRFANLVSSKSRNAVTK